MIKKLFTWLILPLAILGMCYLIFISLTAPINFEKARKAREVVAIERLKDIRTLQVSYKTEFGKFTSTLDSLVDFYNNGTITIVRQIGSMDDSLAVAQKKVTRDSIKVAVKDTLLKREGFCIDSLKKVPFSDKEFEMKALVKRVSGVDVPLFEACVPFDVLLNGLDRQLVVNLNEARKTTDRYPGLKVGDIEQPNNNAGNWE